MAQKYANYGFLFRDLKIFILQQTLQLNKFEGADFKYDNGFFEFRHENIQKRNFWRKCK